MQKLIEQMSHIMRIHSFIAFVIIVSVTTSCSKDSLKRTSYETLKNIHEQQCQKDLSSDCPERESYDAYQRKIRDHEKDQ